MSLSTTTQKSLKSMTLATAMALSLGTTASASGEPDAIDVIRSASVRLQTLIELHHAEYLGDPRAFHRVVDEVVAPAFDLPYISQVVLGRQWRGATPEQRTRFEAAFKSSLIDSYASALLDHVGQGQFKWMAGATDAAAGTATARAELPQSGGAPLSVIFNLHRDPQQQWRVYDVKIEDISLVTNFRSQFVAEIKANGLDALIARLESGPRLVAEAR